MEAASTAAAESAACAATITVRNATTAVSATTAAYVATSSAGIAATGIAAASTISVTAATVSISTAIAEPAAPVVAGVSVEAPVIPGPGTDKQAAIEPVRTVISVRCAGIRVIVVIAPFAIRRTGICVIRGNHRGADAHSNTDLGARRNRGEGKSYKQCQ
jgi:hypothetical protein